MNFKEKKLNSVTVFDGKIFKVEVDDIELPDGKKSFRECVRHSGGAAVLFVKDGCVLLVRQFRYLYGKELYELPAGKLNFGEDSALAAARELEEETGYRAELVHFLDLYPSVGYTDEVIHIYNVLKAEYVKQKLDEGEFLSYKFVPIEKVAAMIDSGEICDAKTVAAVYKYLLKK